MYVACKELTVGNGRRVAIGQPVPEALSWTYPVLVAHLNIGWLKWVEPKEAAVKTEVKVVVKKPVEKKPVVKKAEAVKAPEPQTNTCPSCPGRTFASPKALKTHKTLAHDKRK